MYPRIVHLTLVVIVDLLGGVKEIRGKTVGAGGLNTSHMVAAFRNVVGTPGGACAEGSEFACSGIDFLTQDRALQRA